MNTTKLSAALLGSIMAVTMAQPSFAQAAAASSAPVVPGLAVADFEAVLSNTDANRAAATQRQTTYKAQIDAYEARRGVLAAQIQPLATKLENDAKAPNANQASLQQQAATLRQLQEAGQQELNTMAQPIAYSQAYVAEQIEAKLDTAVKAAMAKKRVSLVLTPQAVMAVNNNAYNLNPDILIELNRAIPTAQIVPPAGWEPRQVREAKAQQAQAAGGAAAPARPAGPQPSGR
ncbi:MAG: rane protein [Novosphingobium sp.]|nr:rane protein [Novosphingobium sp.]